MTKNEVTHLKIRSSEERMTIELTALRNRLSHLENEQAVLLNNVSNNTVNADDESITDEDIADWVV